ncbi:MAG: hypothetical protein AAF236_15850, partial [Verrucomicrobiota bacterium]
NENFDVTVMMAGLQPNGSGIDLGLQAPDSSTVSFFGVSGTGRSVVFIVDSTKEMLIDEKGGMLAFDKVKNEIGALLTQLKRGTRFNIILFEGKQLAVFRAEPVPASPSNQRLAMEWIAPLNRDYESLGMGNRFGETVPLTTEGELPIANQDVSHYTRAIQKAMEWRAGMIFCITKGYRRMSRSHSPEVLAKVAEARAKNPGTPGQVPPAAAKAWQEAVAETRQWLQEENAARREKGLPPKVVINFNGLVREITGKNPPQRVGGTPGASVDLPRLEPITPDDLVDQLKELTKIHYQENSLDPPSVNLVLFLGEDEDIGEDRDHFRDLTRRNGGKLNLLRGLAALSDVTR